MTRLHDIVPSEIFDGPVCGAFNAPSEPINLAPGQYNLCHVSVARARAATVMPCCTQIHASCSEEFDSKIRRLGLR